MMGKTFRPWGLLGWVLDKIPVATWSVLSCHSPEERSISVWEIVSSRAKIEKALFIEVQDPPSRFTPDLQTALHVRWTALRQIAVPSEGIIPLPLFSTESEIVKAVESFLAISSASILFDISCFPKRMFFPFMKRILQCAKIENLVVTYSIPSAYGDILAEDHETLRHLPLFGSSQFPEPTVDFAFVGVGFSPLAGC